jgi:hypothetical protein
MTKAQIMMIVNNMKEVPMIKRVEEEGPMAATSFKGNVLIAGRQVTWRVTALDLRGIKVKRRATMNPGMMTVAERTGGIKEWRNGNLRSQSLVRRKKRQSKGRGTIGVQSVTTGHQLTTPLSILVVVLCQKGVPTPILQPWILLFGVFRLTLIMILTSLGCQHSFKVTS